MPPESGRCPPFSFASCHASSGSLFASLLLRVARQAVLQLVRLYADINQHDNAYRWFEQLRRNAPDFTSVRANREIDNLREDQRFTVLFPTADELSRPFVENVRILHEWRGEAAGDEFGWIARELGDVDKDGITDIVTSATANLPMGSTKGKVYAYSGRSGKLLWKKEGAAGSLFGSTLESAGDTNKDGVPDVVVGAPGINGFFVYSGNDGRELRNTLGVTGKRSGCPGFIVDQASRERGAEIGRRSGSHCHTSGVQPLVASVVGRVAGLTRHSGCLVGERLVSFLPTGNDPM